jgi:hypothetical protein
LAESLKEKWENKVIHGQYIRSIDKQPISEEDMFLCLSKGDLKAETESEIDSGSTGPSTTNKISCNKNIVNRKI